MFVQATLTLAAAGDYGADDVLSESATVGEATSLAFNLAGRERFSIKSMRITSSVTTQTWKGELWLLRETPHDDTVVDDNVAFSLAIEDRLKVAAVLLMGSAMRDVGEIAYGEQVFDPPVDVELGDGETALYAILVTTDAFTDESAGQTVTIELDAA